MGTVKIMRIIESALGSIEKLMVMLTSNRLFIGLNYTEKPRCHH